MERSIATTDADSLHPTVPGRGLRATISAHLVRHDLLHIGLAFVALALAVYLLSNPARQNHYNHFVWQAEAYLDGRFAIRYPVHEGEFVNYYFQDVMPLPERPGFGLIPFPPLPALLLTPFVALFGLGTNAALLGVLLGAINVGLAWRMVIIVTPRREVAALATLFFAFGTVHWYAAMLGSTWFLAHVAAVTFLLLALSLALDGDRRAAEGGRRPVARSASSLIGRLAGAIHPVQFAAGLLLGVAALARLPVIFGAPFFVLVGPGGSVPRRAISAGLGASIPVAGLLLYNAASSGHLFHPAYEYLYQHEYLPRPELINREWAITDPRYLPRNTLIMLTWPPLVQPECGFSLLDRACPLIRPDPLAMSLLLTSPAYLLIAPVLLGAWRRRLVLAAVLAAVPVALVNLMHFSQGWVQFGYRFSNDFAPLLLILAALGIARLGVRPLTIGLVVASIVINAWGVYWGVTLGW